MFMSSLRISPVNKGFRLLIFEIIFVNVPISAVNSVISFLASIMLTSEIVKVV